MLTVLALERPDTFTANELKKATEELSVEGLQHAAITVADMLDGAEIEKRAQYWETRVKPYLTQIWPRLQSLRTELVSRQLALVCVVAGQNFPDALSILKHWLLPLNTSL